MIIHTQGQLFAYLLTLTLTKENVMFKLEPTLFITRQGAELHAAFLLIKGLIKSYKVQFRTQVNPDDLSVDMGYAIVSVS